VSKIVPSEVGVIAVRDIPEDIDPFRVACPEEGVVDLSAEEVAGLPEETRKIVEDFFVADADTGHFPVNKSGPNHLAVSFYVNHSERQPNLKVDNQANGPYFRFRTARFVHKGEELTYTYSAPPP